MNKAPEIPSIHFDLIKDRYRRLGVPEEKLEKFAMDDLKTRALILCNFDKTKLDKDGLPLLPFLIRRLEEETAQLLVDYSYNPDATNQKEVIRLRKIEGQIDPEFDFRDSKRPPLEDIYNPDDPVVGGTVKRFISVSAKHGLETGELVWHQCKAPSANARKEIVYTSIALVKELLFQLGPEIYDAVREKIATKYFQYFSSSDLINHSASELGERLMTLENTAYWNALPRLWVEEVILLVKNPQIVQYLLSLKKDSGVYIKSVRNYIRATSEKHVLEAKNPIKKISKRDYIVSKLLSAEQFDVEKFRKIAGILRKLTGDVLQQQSLGRYQYENRIKEFRNIKDTVGHFFSLDGDMVELSKDLVEICNDISNLDYAFSSGNKAVTGKVKLKPSLLSVRASIGKFKQWLHEFNPTIIEDDQYLLRVEPAKEKEITDQAGIKLKVLSKNPPDIIGQFVGENDILNYVKSRPNLNGHLEEVKNAINKARIEIYVRKKNLYDPNDPEVNFHYYSMIRYIFRMLLDLFPEFFEKDVDENALTTDQPAESNPVQLKDQTNQKVLDLVE
jgi:hypothetical protein